ncbi:MAG TPA: dCTP deaminase [Candidatus Korarchaeota archaeon]|nr:dCTP deaminase [Candidatus Korarchaeota archaeon]
MILSDRDILSAMERGEIKIVPFDRSMLGPCSVDLTLSSRFRLFKPGTIVDPESLDSVDRGAELIDTGGKPFLISPGQFVLGRTREKIAISKSLAAVLEGRSSIARLGVIVHAAGLVNPGSGLKKPVPMILEIFCENTSPVKLYPGMKIVQILFHRLTSPASVGYDERDSSLFVEQREPSLLYDRGVNNGL